jgi:hypothetical protein
VGRLNSFFYSSRAWSWQCSGHAVRFDVVMDRAKKYLAIRFARRANVRLDDGLNLSV